MLDEIYFWQAAMQDCGAKGLGFAKITSSHHIYENSEVKQILSIPVHRNQDLQVGTLTLMKIAQLSEEDLL